MKGIHEESRGSKGKRATWQLLFYCRQLILKYPKKKWGGGGGTEKQCEFDALFPNTQARKPRWLSSPLVNVPTTYLRDRMLIAVVQTIFVCRYDYENVASEGAEAMMESLRAGPAQPGDDLGSGFELKGKHVRTSMYERFKHEFLFFTRLPFILPCGSHGTAYVRPCAYLPQFCISCSFGSVVSC